MNITSDKILGNSNEYYKKLKEVSNKSINENSLSKKINNDFAPLKITNNYVKGKILNNSIKLSDYEEMVTKNQIIAEKIEEMKNLLSTGKIDEIYEIVEKTMFDGENLLGKYFVKEAPIKEQIEYLEALNKDEKLKIEKDFLKIQIANQNVSSLAFAFFDSNKTKDLNQLTNVKLKIDTIKIGELLT